MKKRLTLVLSLISIAGLAGCNNKPTTDSSTVVPAVTGSIKFNKASYSVEKGSSVTVRASIVTDEVLDDATLKFTCEQDGEIVELPAVTTGVVSISVKGLNVGTATIKAVSVARPEINGTVEVEVTKVKKVLNRVWSNVIGYNNYTLNSYNPDESTTEPTTVVKVTTNGVTQTDASGAPLAANKIYFADETAADGVGSHDAVGIAIDADTKLAYYLQQDNGQFIAPTESIKANVGLLNSKNFLGLKADATSWMDVDSTFFGLQAINPSWLPSKKEATNVYTIEGSQEDVNSAAVEALLWQLIDPNGKNEFIVNNKLESGYYSYDLAAAIDTTITVVNDNEISVTIVETESQVTHTMSMANVGTTELDADVKSFMSGVTTVNKPALGDYWDLVRSEAAKNNYVFSFAIPLDKNGTTATYYGYYTEDYFMAYYPQEFVDVYNPIATAQGHKAMEAGGAAIVRNKTSQTYSVCEYVPATDTAKATFTKVEDLKKQDGSLCNFTDFPTMASIPVSSILGDFTDYLSTASFIAGDSIYNFTSSPSEIFSGYGQWLFTQDKSTVTEVATYLGNNISGSSVIGGVGIDVAQAGKGYTISEMRFLLAASSNGTSYSIYYTPVIKYFGSAHAQNPAASLIDAYLNPAA